MKSIDGSTPQTHLQLHHFDLPHNACLKQRCSYSCQRCALLLLQLNPHLVPLTTFTAAAACDSLIHASDAVHWSTCLVAAVAARLASATPSNPNKSLMLRGSWAASFGFEVCQHPQVLLHHGVKRVHAVVECAAVGIAGAAGVLMAVNFEGNGSGSSLQHCV